MRTGTTGVEKVDLGLKGRVAIVTGSSKGIGKAIGLGLAGEGVKVAICARDESQLIRTAREMESVTRSKILPVPADLTRQEDIERLIGSTHKAFGRIDILVNNTGGPPSGAFLDTSDQEWQKALDSLLFSVVRSCRLVVPYMRTRKWGRIINMTSFAAKQPADKLVLSNSLRAGILGLTKTLSNELAPDGILVNAVCPGFTHTSRLEELAKWRAGQTQKTYEDVILDWQEGIPIGRMAQPKEIADLVVFLASERAGYITGAVIQVDGGLTRSLF